MPKTTTPVPTTAPLSAIEIARRAARSENADIGMPGGFAEGGVPLAPTPGGRNDVLVAGVEIRAFSPNVRVTLPRILESDVKEQAATQSTAKAAELTTIASSADLGRLVRKVREGRGLSQQEFADLAGVGRRFLSELENGKLTLELGKVLKVVNAAGIALLARER
ncbi:helix-turn-helix transcriptional regulator [Mesorhizobium loti]|uniref:helix-turn-helix transcriptional regulator n=1 Tax=Rhizobium loti TaxID=381 RepID=UPI00041ECE76|nr:helix-turn-helix transcriptional regulator [Mesorhizobium loti]